MSTPKLPILVLLVCLSGCQTVPPSPPLARPSNETPRAEPLPPAPPTLSPLLLRVQYQAWQHQKISGADRDSQEESQRIEDLDKQLKAIGAHSVEHQRVPLRTLSSSGLVKLEFKGKKVSLKPETDYQLVGNTAWPTLKLNRCALVLLPAPTGQDLRGQCTIQSASDGESLDLGAFPTPALIVRVVIVDSARFDNDVPRFKDPILRQPGGASGAPPVTLFINAKSLPAPLKDLEHLIDRDKKSLFLTVDLSFKSKDSWGINLIATFYPPVSDPRSDRMVGVPLDRLPPSLDTSPPNKDSLCLIGTLAAVDLALHAPSPPQDTLHLVIYDGALGRQFFDLQHPAHLAVRTPSSCTDPSTQGEWLAYALPYQALLLSLLGEETR